jgi:hypothetical protein
MTRHAALGLAVLLLVTSGCAFIPGAVSPGAVSAVQLQKVQS